MFNPNAPKTTTKYAIPVGTSNILEYGKFMLNKRDVSCKSCKNGIKSVVNKIVGTSATTVPVICTCVPYIQSQDETGRNIVMFKGNRELWKGEVRSEVYIQKEIEAKNKLAALNGTFEKMRKNTTAHENVNAGKYVVGLNRPESEMRGIKKAVEITPEPKAAESVKPIEKSDLDKFLETNGSRKAAFRTKAGTIVVVDAETARRMGDQGILASILPQREEKPKVQEENKETTSKGKKKEEPSVEVSNETTQTATTEVATVKPKGKPGRPKGAKNKV